MLLPITTITASVLTLIYFIMTMYVIKLRTTGGGPSIGLEGDERFTRAVRAHGNFSEYTPLFLLLLVLHEVQSGWVLSMIVIAVTFTVGRIAHAIGFGLLGRGPGRSVGMMCTNTSLVVLALANVAMLVL